MTQAPSLVRELKSCKLQDEAKGKKRLCIEKDYVCMYVCKHTYSCTWFSFFSKDVSTPTFLASS